MAAYNKFLPATEQMNEGMNAGSDVWKIVLATALAGLTCGTPSAGTGFTIYARSTEKLQGTFALRWILRAFLNCSAALRCCKTMKTLNYYC